MRVQVKYISVWSAVKVGCLMTVIPIVCITGFLLLVVLMPAVAFTRNLSAQLNLIGGGSSAAFFIIAGGFLAGIGTAISWASTAMLYNTIAWLFGGIKVDLEREQVVVRPPIGYSQFDDPAPNESVSAWQNVRQRSVE